MMEISPTDINIQINGTYRSDVTLMANSNGQKYLRSILEEDPFLASAIQSCPYKTPLIQISVRIPPPARKSNRGCMVVGIVVLAIIILLFIVGLIAIISGKN